MEAGEMSFLRVSFVALVIALVAPVAADAAIRYAEPGGNGAEPCNLADPCEIHAAAQGHTPSDVGNGDEIILLPGDYSLTAGIELLDPNLKFHGQAGQPRPRLVSTGTTAVFANQNGTEISHLDIEQSGTQSGLNTAFGTGMIIDEVSVHTFNPESFSFTCQLQGTVTMKNSICWSSGAAGAAIGVNTSGGTANVTLRNVTAVSTSASAVNSFGIYYSGDFASTSLVITATNVIADGVVRDVQAFASGGATVSITLDHSNYSSAFGIGAATVTAAGSGTNQTAPPVYLDAATGGFHQASGSPTINQGVNDPANGTFDIDLEPRTVNTTTDIGADEFVSADTDGDGVLDGADDCRVGDTLWTSGPLTDHEPDGCRDAGEDLDDDNDSKLDGDDACPAGDVGWTSTATTDVDSDGCRDAGEDTDDDNDTVADGSDNCRTTPNLNQANYDGDAQGDVCDNDDDDDNKLDGADSCPTGALGWTSNATTDVDGDGCRDVDEDTDDDNDTKLDGDDNCSAGDTGWTSSAATDHDDDGCRDAGEDTDDDNDTAADGVDDCPTGETGWISTPATDIDGEGCRDAGEDTDDDNDSVNDGSDNCALAANADQANNDGDAQGDVCDSDDDNDGVEDESDACPTQAGPDGGCPQEEIKDTTAPDTTIGAHPGKRVFKRRARFVLSSDDSGAHFECSLDGKAFAPCAASVQYRVKYGKHRFAARAVDTAGNADATPATWEWKAKPRRR
jgi:hypothetical protein